MKLYETINEGNWIKHQAHTRDFSRHCLIGHAGMVYGLCAEEFEVLDRTACLLYPERTKAHYALRAAANFNDHPDTTIEDVLRVCKVADV